MAKYIIVFAIASAIFGQTVVAANTENADTTAIEIVNTVNNSKSVAVNAPTDTTSTGVKFYNSRDYRYEDTDKVHHELRTGLLATKSGSLWAAGVSMEALRIYDCSNHMGWFWGGEVNLTQSLNELDGSFSLVDVLPELGLRLGGKAFSVEAALLGGVGQSLLSNRAVSSDGLQSWDNLTNKWGLTCGAKLGVKVRASEKVSVTIGVQYVNSMINDDEFSVPEGWSKEPSRNLFKDKLSLNLSVNIVLDNTKKLRHVSGDNCWHVSPYAVYSLTDHEGMGAGLEIFQTKRLNYHWMREAGFGAEQTFGQTKANRVFGKFGFEWLPKGSSSPFIWTAGIKAGLGQFNQTASGATSDESFATHSETLSLGVYANLYAGMKIHVGRVCFNAGVEGGPRTTFGSSFHALNESDYAGSTAKTFGFNGRVTAGVSFAF